MTRFVVFAVVVSTALAGSPSVRAQGAAPQPPPPATPDKAAPPAAAPPATPPTEATPPAADAAPPADAKGTLSVSSTPPGKVYLDGADTGLVTPIVDLPVAAGPHTLRIVEEGTGRETSTELNMEPGGALNLNLSLPEAEPVKTDAPAESTEPAVAAEAPAATEAPWTWMTVTGWAGLGLGTIGLLAGAVVLTSEADQDREPLGFGLFGTGVGLLLGGGVLLYLDTELADATAAPAAAPAR
jgi:hypothetical protein